MGINPIAVYQRRQILIGGPTEEELMADEKEIQDKVEGMNMGDAVLLRTFKAMGLSDKTMVQIEKDLRLQTQAALEPVPPPLSQDKVEKEATKGF